MRQRIEWDPEKARSNFRKHGIAFEVASTVFDDPYHRSKPDERVGYEDRWQTIGMVNGVSVTFVAHARIEVDDGGWPTEVIRIISARRATKAERAFYERGRGWRR